MQKHNAALHELGFQLIAIAPDTPGNLLKTRQKNKLDFVLLSDSTAAVLKAYGIAWGKPGKRILPVPAVFVIGADGKIAFHFVNPTYQVRLDPQVLLAAARATVQ